MRVCLAIVVRWSCWCALNVSFQEMNTHTDGRMYCRPTSPVQRCSCAWVSTKSKCLASFSQCTSNAFDWQTNLPPHSITLIKTYISWCERRPRARQHIGLVQNKQSNPRKTYYINDDVVWAQSAVTNLPPMCTAQWSANCMHVRRLRTACTSPCWPSAPPS